MWVTLLIITLIFLFAIILFLILFFRSNVKPRFSVSGLDETFMLRSIENSLNVLVNQYQLENPGNHSVDLTLEPHSSSSHIINRKKIYICVKDRITGQLFNKNTILQVAVHELSHALCPREETQEHGPKFYKINNKLNAIAERLKIFDPHQEIPERYYDVCTSNPT